MTITNKHLLFRRFPDLPEHVMDRIIELYQSRGRPSKEEITKKVCNSTDFKLSKKTTCEFIDFAKKNCGLKFAVSEERLVDSSCRMRFFKDDKLIRQVVFN